MGTTVQYMYVKTCLVRNVPLHMQKWPQCIWLASLFTCNKSNEYIIGRGRQPLVLETVYLRLCGMFSLDKDKVTDRARTENLV